MRYRLLLFSALCLLLLTSCQTINLSVDNRNEDNLGAWWYKLNCALADPTMVHVSLANELEHTFTVSEPIYLKDFDDLCMSVSDYREGNYISAGLIYGHILSLPKGTYYHYGNSGVMYVTQSDVDAVDDAASRHYKRLRYVLETPPDLGIKAIGKGKNEYSIKVGENGSVLSFGASGCGFVGANVYINGRTVNGLGLGSYSPIDQNFNYVGNMHNTPLNMVPLPSGYEVTLHVVRNDSGLTYFKVHHCQDWW